MTAPSVSRRDITLEESIEDEEVGYSGTTTYYSWEARLYGRASTGETVEMKRTGATSAAAYAELKSALAEQGWTIRDGV